MHPSGVVELGPAASALHLLGFSVSRRIVSTLPPVTIVSFGFKWLLSVAEEPYHNLQLTTEGYLVSALTVIPGCCTRRTSEAATFHWFLIAQWLPIYGCTYHRGCSLLQLPMAH